MAAQAQTTPQASSLSVTGLTPVLSDQVGWAAVQAKALSGW